MTAPTLTSPIRVDRWPSEIPLTIVAILISGAVWLGLALSIAGLVVILYIALFAGLIFLAHAFLIGQIRGSGVRLGPDQFPELYAAVESLAQRIGLHRVPETYLVQAGGALNAFATKFFRGRIVVLYSDLLDACGENRAARDMIIAHELGHLHAGHLSWMWFLLPAYLLPWPGRHLSRAREYTCDRYGLAAADDPDGALTGLTILAAGGKLGPRVNREAMVRQTESLNTGFMVLAQWFATHPPLARRLAALDPELARHASTSMVGYLRVGLVAALLLLAVGWGSWTLFQQGAGLASVVGGGDQVTTAGASLPGDSSAPTTQAVMEADLGRVAAFLQGEVAAGRGVPGDDDEFYSRWAEVAPNLPPPMDPVDGTRYLVRIQADSVTIVSVAGSMVTRWRAER
jgi:Zn-dependent protease with chaperone function